MDSPELNWVSPRSHCFGSVSIYGEPSDKLALQAPIAERKIKVIRAEDVVLQVGTGIVVRPDGTAVPETTYMTKLDVSPTEVERSRQVDASQKVWITYNAGWRNYYHWTVQSMFSTYLALNKLGANCDVFVFPQLAPNAKELLHYVAERPSVIQGYFFNKNTRLGVRHALALESTYGALVFEPSPLLADFASHVLKNTPVRRGNGRKIYISRRDSAKRTIENEEQVIKYLEGRGFVSLELSRLTVADQINSFANADIVVAPHGAGLTNTIYCDSGARIVEMMPSSYQNPCFLRIGQVLGKDWHVCIFEAEATEGLMSASNKVGRWSVDIDVLEAAIAG